LKIFLLLYLAEFFNFSYCFSCFYKGYFSDFITSCDSLKNFCKQFNKIEDFKKILYTIKQETWQHLHTNTHKNNTGQPLKTETIDNHISQKPVLALTPNDNLGRELLLLFKMSSWEACSFLRISFSRRAFCSLRRPLSRTIANRSSA